MNEQLKVWSCRKNMQSAKHRERGQDNSISLKSKESREIEQMAAERVWRSIGRGRQVLRWKLQDIKAEREMRIVFHSVLDTKMHRYLQLETINIVKCPQKFSLVQSKKKVV